MEKLKNLNIIFFFFWWNQSTMNKLYHVIYPKNQVKIIKYKILKIKKKILSILSVANITCWFFDCINWEKIKYFDLTAKSFFKIISRWLPLFSIPFWEFSVNRKKQQQQQQASASIINDDDIYLMMDLHPL